ncbi:hypothetical protein ACIPY5_09500 [Microbacterium sp. NPDC089698]|jgi:hypothetical protein|uniref:hypothetical protein n=1 Tax=unclassified Microbacterium TaxID=2609290 RepID=UPI002831CF5E|nr:hypothetical protein [Microbacterium sp.]MDR2323530.1 hypothetical protein [Microbacterium sp.]
MARFLVTYAGMGHPDPAQMEAARAAFGAWLAQAGPIVVDPGAPVSHVGDVSAQEPAPAPAFSGYSILEADTVGEVQDALASHPFVSRGGTLQINQLL